jgi:hypothetical protein
MEKLFIVYCLGQTVIFRGIFSMYYSPGGAGAGDIIFLRVPNILEGCDGWGEGRGILYLTSVVHWKDIRPWRPELGLEGSFCFRKQYIYIFCR